MLSARKKLNGRGIVRSLPQKSLTVPAGLMRIPDLTGLPDRTAKITAIKFRMSLPIKAILKLMLQNGKRLEHLRIR